jgi:hypothetical protein
MQCALLDFVYHNHYNSIELLETSAHHHGSGPIGIFSTMASRSPTLRPSSDPFGPDAEKDAQTLDNPNIAPNAEKRRRSSLGAAFRRQSENKEVDPFDDEEGDGVKYRTLKWWYVSALL